VEVIGEPLDKHGLADTLLPDQGQVCALALLGQLGVVVQSRQDLAAIGEKDAFVFFEQHSHTLFSPRARASRMPYTLKSESEKLCQLA
jgi:hypothetical protein